MPVYAGSNTDTTHPEIKVLSQRRKQLKELQIDDEKFSSDSTEESKFIITSTKNQYTFTTRGMHSFNTVCYVLQNFAIKNRHLITHTKYTTEYEYDYKQYSEVITYGNIVFEWNKNLYNLFIDGESYQLVIKSNVDIGELIVKLKHEIKYNNPLKGKLFQVKQAKNDFIPIMKKIPNLTFKDIILDEKLKEDIYDNTIFQLDNLDENNGVIFFGEPGVGKSLLCGAIANEATKRKYTVAYLSTQVDYSLLNEFIEELVSPCILIFEDIDAFGERRENAPGLSAILSDFLQFINGISEKSEKIIFIATTNYLDKLDKAIANRPVRFNRKFEFKYPSDTQIDELVNLYFNEDISKKYAHLCYKKNFSGAHIKEIQRTANLLSKKRNEKIDVVFQDAVGLVSENFSPKLNEIGF